MIGKKYKLCLPILLTTLLAVAYPLHSLWKKRTELSFRHYAQGSLMEEKDFQKVLSIHRESFAKNRARNIASYIQQRHPHISWADITLDRDIILKELEKKFDPQMRKVSNYRVLYRGKTPVAFYNLYPDDSFLEKAWMIYNVCVDPKWRSRGFGRKLIQHAIKEHAGRDNPLGLLIYRENDLAFRLYKKMNFQKQKISRRPKDPFSSYGKMLMVYKGEKHP